MLEWIELFLMIMLPIIGILLLPTILELIFKMLDRIGLSDHHFWLQWEESFLESHPELSEEEYLLLFDPPVDKDVALKVRKLISEISGLEENRIRPQDRLVTDLGLE